MVGGSAIAFAAFFDIDSNFALITLLFTIDYFLAGPAALLAARLSSGRAACLAATHATSADAAPAESSLSGTPAAVLHGSLRVPMTACYVEYALLCDAFSLSC